MSKSSDIFPYPCKSSVVQRHGLVESYSIKTSPVIAKGVRLSYYSRGLNYYPETHTAETVHILFILIRLGEMVFT